MPPWIDSGQRQSSPDDGPADARDLHIAVYPSPDQRALDVRSATKLPDVCIFTGEPTGPSQRVQRELTWTPRWFSIAWVITTPLAALSYAYFRRIAVAIAAMLFAVSFIERPETVVMVLLMLLIPLGVGAPRSRLFSVLHIDKGQMRIHLTLKAAQALARLS